MNRTSLKKLMIALAIIFFCCNVVFASYIFNNTVRENDPDIARQMEGALLVSDLNGSGEAYAYGVGNTVYYQFLHNPVPSRASELQSVVESVIISDNIKLVAASDTENNIYLFSYGSGPTMNLIYTLEYEEPATLGGLVVIGQKSYIARLLVHTQRSIYVHDDDFIEPIWSWNFDTDIRTVAISHYGDITAVGEDSGKLSFFRTFDASLSWDCQCDSAITSIAVSPFALYALVGTQDGSLYLYDLDNKELEWKTTLSGPITYTSLRSSASVACAVDSAGTLVLFEQDGTRLSEYADVTGAFMPFWGELVAYTTKDRLYVTRETRTTPEWYYPLKGDTVRFLDSNYGFTTSMVSTRDSLLFFFDEQLMVLGSRMYWSALALLVIGQALVLGYLAYLRKGLVYSIIQNREMLEFFVGAAGGLILSLLISRSAGSYNSMNIIVAVISCGLASWQCSRLKGGFVGAFAGYVAGFFGSLAIGAAFGIYNWLGGAEDNILMSLFGTAFVGGLLGAIFSVVGVGIGLFIKGYFEEYRLRKHKRV
jgi:outer membrane protein assembly factor BamB